MKKYFYKIITVLGIVSILLWQNVAWATIVVVDSYSETNANKYYSVYSAQSIFGQCFQAPNNYTATSAKFYLAKSGLPTGTASVYTSIAQGTCGTDGRPGGSSFIETASIDVSTLGTSFALQEFTFNDIFNFVSGTYYSVFILYNGGDASNYVKIGYDDTTPTHAGNLFYYTTGWGVSAVQDLSFYVYGNDVVSMLTADAFQMGMAF